MATQTTAELIYKLTDQFSAPAHAMARSIDEMNGKLGRIEQYRAAARNLDTVKQKLLQAKTAAKQAADAFASTPSMKLGRAAARTAADVDNLRRSFMRQGQALREMRSALNASDTPINKLAASERRLRTEVDKTNQAMSRQKVLAQQQASAVLRRQERRQEWGNVGAVAGLMLAHKARQFGRGVVEVGRDFDKERRFSQAIMGESDVGMRPLVDQAIHLAASSRYNDIQVLEAQRTLAARGVKKDGILGMIPQISNYGMAMDLSLPDAAAQIERSLFTFQRDVSSKEKAVAAARRTADLQVKASKISGMTPDDLGHLYNFGAPSAKTAGMKEESLLAMGATLKKAGIGGDQAGVAYRAMIASLTRMTRIGRTAMLANGLNYADYQRVPDQLELDPFVSDVAQTYGIELNKGARSRLGAVFSNKELVQDPAKFTPAVKKILEDELGKQDAKSAKAIASSANRYRDSSGKSVDIDRLLYDVMTVAADNPNLLNSIFGSKQGGRLAAAIGNPEEFKKMFREIFEGSEGYSKDIADKRNEGFDAALVRLENTVKNAQTSIYRAFDNGGEGTGGLLTAVTDQAGKLAQGFAELNPAVIRVATQVGAAGTAFLAFKSVANISKLLGGAGLSASAVALDGSAVALTRAAAVLGTSGGLPGKFGTAGSVAGGVAATRKTGSGILMRTGGALLKATGVLWGLSLLGDVAGEAAGSLGLLSKEAEKVEGWQKLFTLGTQGEVAAPELREMNARAAQREAAKTPEQRSAETEAGVAAKRNRVAADRAAIGKIEAHLAAQKAKLDAGKLNPRVYADLEKGAQAELNRLYAKLPEDQGSPRSSGSNLQTQPGSPANGIPLPPSRPNTPEFAGAAQNAFGGFSQAMQEEIAKIDQQVQTAVARWVGMLSFSAGPSITADISTTGGGPQPMSSSRRADMGLDRSRQTSLRDSKAY